MGRNYCGTCKAYLEEKQAREIGTCHVNPPIVQLVMMPGARTPSNPNGNAQLTAQGFWPPVRGAADWCLRWQAKLSS